MTDIAHLLDNLFADLGGDGAPSLPTFPTSFPTAENEQATDKQRNSHNSHTSHSENKASRNSDLETPSNAHVSAGESRVTSSYDGGVGNVGNVGNPTETLAVTGSYDFPLSSLLVGKEEEEWEIPALQAPIPDPSDAGPQLTLEHEAPDTPRSDTFLDLNLAKPQRSDWWTGDPIVEIDRAAPPPGDPLPISPSDVRAGVARELRALAEGGREGADALRDAVEITRAKIRNSEALAERQANGAACHVCDQPLDDTLPVIAVLSWSRGAPLYLHAACHDAYRARRTALVDRIMASAGYGETLTNGAAA